MISKMKLSIVAAAIVVFAQADVALAKSNNKGKIEGTLWSSKAANFDGVPVPAGVITLEFKRDQSLTFKIVDMVYKGTYELGDGDEVTFTFEKELDGEKVHVETVTVKGTDLTVTDSDGVSIAFEKAGR